jgi:DNA-directed RNA polymerase specialized sigma24 family protein
MENNKLRTFLVESDTSVNDIIAAFTKLTKSQMTAIEECLLRGKSTAEVATILCCSENTVKTHLMRAKAKVIDFRLHRM